MTERRRMMRPQSDFRPLPGDKSVRRNNMYGQRPELDFRLQHAFVAGLDGDMIVVYTYETVESMKTLEPRKNCLRLDLESREHHEWEN